LENSVEFFINALDVAFGQLADDALGVDLFVG
jgi:hypothetical protein